MKKLSPEERKKRKRGHIVTKFYDDEKIYHDDMHGEDVWFSIDYPIATSDYREFNGMTLKEIAKETKSQIVYI